MRNILEGAHIPATPDEVLRQWFREVWDEGKEDAIDRLAAPDLRAYGLGAAGDPPIVGTAGFKELFHTFREALGDMQIAVDKTVVQGDHCAVLCHVKGRHVGSHLVDRRRTIPFRFTEW